MNLSIFIFFCALVSQIAHYQCKNYETCHKSENGKGCIAWTKNAICKIDGCRYNCWPNFFECCGCDISSSCFPSASKVYLENVKSVTMSELQLGDRVKTGNKVYLNKTGSKA